MPRALSAFLGALLFGCLAFLVQEPDADVRLAREAEHLQTAVTRASLELEARTSDLSHALASESPEVWMERRVGTLELERAHTGTIYLGYQNDSLVCWSGPMIVSPDDPEHASAGHVNAPHGIYLHSRSSVGSTTLHGFRPIWSSPAVENRYLNRGFHPSLRSPPGLVVTDGTLHAQVLFDRNRDEMLRIGWRDGALELGSWLWLKLIFTTLSGLFLLAALWVSATRLLESGRRGMAAFVFIAGVVALRGACLWLLPTSAFTRTPLFDPAVYATSLVFASMGDLLLNAVLLFLVALLLSRILRRVTLMPGGLLAGTLIILLLLAIANWITRLIIGLVNDSSVDLDLYHVQGLGAFSLLAVLSIALLLGAWVALGQALLGCWVAGRKPAVIWASLAVSVAISSLVHHFYGVVDTLQFLWPVTVLGLLLSVRSRGFRFVHAVLGVTVLAMMCTHLLTRYTERREHRDRLVLAERLATREDPVVERMFRETAPLLRSDRELYALLIGTAPCGPTELDRAVRQRFFGGYWERYDVRLFAFGSNGQVRCATDPEPPRSFSSIQGDLELPFATSDMPDLFIEEQPGRSPFYHARVAVMPVDSLQPAQLIVELHPRTAVQGLGFPELLLSGDDMVSRKAERYTYARFENGDLVERRGAYIHPLRWKGDLGSDGTLWWHDRGYVHLAKGDAAATLIILSLPLPGILDQATTFSYLFAVFSLLFALFLGISAMLQARGVPSLGIGAKVRLALVLFTLAGSVFFGIGTQHMLSRQFEQRFEASVLEKARSVHQELQQKLDGEPVLNASHAPYLDHLLARMSNVFFTDITVYTSKGLLLSTSRPQIFSNGLLGSYMDPVAYRELALRGLGAFVHREAIGTASYRAAYMPLRDRRGKVLAFIALPGFADQALQEQERADVLVAVVNLFVLLFALSVLVAVFISNWTTRPLDLLKNALARVGLQEANEPIRYRGDDEIGQLVDVYNRKVEELRESADRLARSERESAWREMARQVAHEIKNPLTPMKLNIQHFQRTWTPDAPDAAARLERFSTGMVEQIDTLSGIAGAFSNFAQMPRAQEEDLDLAEVAEAAISLFDATPGVHCTLEHQHTGPVPVRADREQLLRTFNNLLKNAVQSIPDGREGHIHLVLRSAAGEAIAEIHDNGSGIAEADKERIFRPNFTTKSSGMGLGLAMVQRMVETAGGRVWFETEEGAGSTFFVALPLRKP